MRSPPKEDRDTGTLELKLGQQPWTQHLVLGPLTWPGFLVGSICIGCEQHTLTRLHWVLQGLCCFAAKNGKILCTTEVLNTNRVRQIYIGKKRNDLEASSCTELV